MEVRRGDELREEWVDVHNYEGLYQVSNLGRVKRLPVKQRVIRRGSEYFRNIPGGIIKGSLSTGPNGGYVKVRLSKDGQGRDFGVHRLVASAFLTNPRQYEEVNHKNEVKDDNRVDNLEWCDRKYNVNYGTRKERIYNHPNFIKMARETGKRRRKPVKATDINSGEITYYESTMDVQRKLGIGNASVSRVCLGKRKQASGYKFEYI